MHGGEGRAVQVVEVRRRDLDQPGLQRARAARGPTAAGRRRTGRTRPRASAPHSTSSADQPVRRRQRQLGPLGELGQREPAVVLVERAEQRERPAGDRGAGGGGVAGHAASLPPTGSPGARCPSQVRLLPGAHVRRHGRQGEHGEHGREREHVEAPRVGDAGGHQRAAERRPDDRADPADAGGHAERRAADLGRVEVADEGVDEHLRAEHEDARQQHRDVDEERALDLDRQQRQEDRGQTEPERARSACCRGCREIWPATSRPTHGADVEHEEQRGAGLDGVARLAHDRRAARC